MKAIPTHYRGTTFRSRLEADWAATLDARGVPWDYEPEGYQLSDGTWYSPDFWLPSARAWLEVKGSHMLRVTKVYQFAADLWAESGATSTYDAEAPMVLIGQPPLTDWDVRVANDKQPLQLLGTMGPGKAYSVAITHCRACDRGTAIALWQPTCRGCGHNYGDGYEAWSDSCLDSWFRGFERVVRPAGKS